MDCSVDGEYEFSGIGHIVSIKVKNAVIDVEVTNGLTNEAWQATFDAPFIEGMTKKTGNFKHFNVFINMLRSAVLKTTDSVWLDLLSYADLEKLRAKRNGSDASSHFSNPINATNSNKRYLILMYNVEFDRIHFPLPLSPAPGIASSDLAHVHAVVVRDLQNEIRSLKGQLNSDYRIVGYEELKRDYERIVEEKYALEEGFRQLQEECQAVCDSGSAKQVRMLKNVIRQLEQDVVELKAASQHAVTRKDKDIKGLMSECEDLRSSERMLKARVKSLSQELQTFKRYNASTKFSRNNSVSSDYESNVRPVRPSPKTRFNPSGSLSAREYGTSAPKGVLYSSRNRSTSRDNLNREVLRQRATSRSPSSSRVPARVPRPQQNDLQLSARSRRLSKGPAEKPLPPFRFSSRSPSPAGRLGLSSQRSGAVNSGTKGGLISRGIRTPSVSSIASNNSDLSIAFGNSSLNISNNNAKSYLRRGPVAKAVAAGVRPNLQSNLQRQAGKQKIAPRKVHASFDSSIENVHYFEDDFALPSSTKAGGMSRPLIDSQVHNRAAEMLEIDARLKRLHSLLKETDLGT